MFRGKLTTEGMHVSAFDAPSPLNPRFPPVRDQTYKRRAPNNDNSRGRSASIRAGSLGVDSLQRTDRMK
jgi:hypothetical protein